MTKQAMMTVLQNRINGREAQLELLHKQMEEVRVKANNFRLQKMYKPVLMRYKSRETAIIEVILELQNLVDLIYEGVIDEIQ